MEYNYEVRQCRTCHEYFPEFEVYGNFKGHYCNDCLNDYMTNNELCFLFIADDNESFNHGNVSVREYVELNKEAFAEWLNKVNNWQWNNKIINKI